MWHEVALHASVQTRVLQEKRLPKYTFSSISFCYHGEPVHRSTSQLHVIKVNPAVVACQHKKIFPNE